MNRKDILELKRRFKKEQCTFTKLCGCYVNGEKTVLLEFDKNFLNLPEEDYYKYLEISKKLLSGSIGNNILELDFPLDENFENEKQTFLMQLKRSGLKDGALLRKLYDSIIENYDTTDNFLILVLHDAYDVIRKTSDNLKLDESEEVFEYVMCAVCPVSLSKPGLGYFEVENDIKARIRDWVVDAPVVGFTYPAFIDRSSDVNKIMYYTKNAKEPRPEIMENTLGCLSKQTTTIQKETFETIIKGSVSVDEDVSEKVFSEVQDNLNTMIEEYNELYEDTEVAPISLSKDKINELLIDSGISEDITEKIQRSLEEEFGEDMPLAEDMIDKKVLKANEQKKIEKILARKVEDLEQELEEAKNIASEAEVPESIDSVDNNATSDPTEEEALEDVIVDANNVPPNYDVVLHVKPSKLKDIKTEVIDGQRCIVVPMDDDELATINGISDYQNS